MRRRFTFEMLLALASIGCSNPHFDHLFYSDVSAAPGKVSLRPKAVQIEKGVAVRARVDVIDDSGDPMGNAGLRSSDPSVFGVDPGPSPSQFVFYGVEEGTAELDVYSDYGYEASLPVTVLP